MSTRQVVVCATGMRHRPHAHATISGNSSRQNAPPWDPARSCMTTSASASRSASAHRQARRTRPRRRYVGAEAPEQEPALHPPRHRTPQYVPWAAPRQTATPSIIGERPRRRTSRVPRSARAQSPVSTPGAVASHRSAYVHRRSWWTVSRPSRATFSTSRFPDRHRRPRLLRAGPVERTPRPPFHRRTGTSG